MRRPIETVVAALESKGCKPKRTASGYEALCPAHKDKSPSLSVGEGAEGRALVNCHAGCDLGAILDALVLETSDLFPVDGATHESTATAEPGPVFVSPVPKDAPRSPASHPTLGEPSSRWNYHDAEGRPLYAVLRFDPPGGKEIRVLTLWQEPDGSMVWKWKHPPAPRVLYGLPALASDPGAMVLVVEGEKAADAARSLSPALVMITSPGGSSAVEKADWTPLKGRSVVVWPDQDEPGRKYAASVARLVLDAGARSVSVVAVPEDWPKGWDLADELPEGVQVEDLALMIANAKAVKPETPAGVRTQDPEPLQRPIPDPIEYPVDALGETLAPVCRILNEIVKAPLATCAHSILSAGALVAQAQHDIEIDGRRMPLSLSLLSVLESGGRKSAVDRVALGPLSREEAQAFETYRAEWSSYEADLAAWNHARNDALKQAKGREKKREALESVGPKPEQPMAPMMMTEEPTYEGVVKLLENRPYIGLYSDEGGRFLGGHAMSSDNRLKTLTGLSSLWDGNRISRTRAGDGSDALYGRRVSLHLMLQPEVALTLLGDPLADGQGFLARCLVAAPASTVGEQMYVEADPTTTPEYQRYGAALRRLCRQPLPLGEAWALDPVSLRLDAEAKAVWIQYHDYTQEEMRENGTLQPIKRLASKAAEHALRLAGVIHAVDGGPATLNALGIERGIALTQYYLEEALRLQGVAQANPDLVLAERLLGWLQGRPGGLVPVRDIYRLGPNPIRDKATAEKLLKILEGHGWASLVDGGADVDGQHHRLVWKVRA